MVAANRLPTLLDLREDLARAEVEFTCAEFISDTARMRRERERWAAEITRLRIEISQREEGWSGVWKMSL
jgi:hypothetical protein